MISMFAIALLPIPAQVVVVDVELGLPRVPVAGAVGDAGDESGRRVDGRRCFQNGAGVVERDDSGIHVRDGGNGGASGETFAARRDRDDREEIGLAWRSRLGIEAEVTFPTSTDWSRFPLLVP